MTSDSATLGVDPTTGLPVAPPRSASAMPAPGTNRMDTWSGGNSNFFSVNQLFRYEEPAAFVPQAIIAGGAGTPIAGQLKENTQNQAGREARFEETLNNRDLTLRQGLGGIEQPPATPPSRQSLTTGSTSQTNTTLAYLDAKRKFESKPQRLGVDHQIRLS